MVYGPGMQLIGVRVADKEYYLPAIAEGVQLAVSGFTALNLVYIPQYRLIYLELKDLRSGVRIRGIVCRWDMLRDKLTQKLLDLASQELRQALCPKAPQYSELSMGVTPALRRLADDFGGLTAQEKVKAYEAMAAEWPALREQINGFEPIYC